MPLQDDREKLGVGRQRLDDFGLRASATIFQDRMAVDEDVGVYGTIDNLVFKSVVSLVVGGMLLQQYVDTSLLEAPTLVSLVLFGQRHALFVFLRQQILGPKIMLQD
ncbi:hypothetical protein [Bradyrhizobium sp.]|uniref:hypothetical protein n=1 Tax=Bradyrhizobium sp. TaxID=376 RepID=UPI0027316675|nr:hypothetical protein [Bradyrhizobium sp.]MDP1869695.1 hypothetical protein [Bradyrhizobium sp.]MDP3075652.1 hypothetical protein [Bradyrhizobium sp.]